MFSVSATTPWPGSAASPWIRTGSTLRRPSASVRAARSWRARARPVATLATNSRWLGLAQSDTRTSAPEAVRYAPLKPWWYLTSPPPCSKCGSQLSSNSVRIISAGLPATLCSTLRRPRWAMPITHSSAPARAASPSRRSSTTRSDSPPSSPKRFLPMNRVARKFSKPSAATSRSRMRTLAPASAAPRAARASMRSAIQARRDGQEMKPNSAPTVPQ